MFDRVYRLFGRGRKRTKTIVAIENIFALSKRLLMHHDDLNPSDIVLQGAVLYEDIMIIAENTKFPINKYPEVKRFIKVEKSNIDSVQLLIPGESLDEKAET